MNVDLGFTKGVQENLRGMQILEGGHGIRKYFHNLHRHQCSMTSINGTLSRILGLWSKLR